MTPGYSKILIYEFVIPDQRASCFMTRSDINMMALLGSMERSEKKWRYLLGRAGLDIAAIWSKEAGSESIINMQFE